MRSLPMRQVPALARAGPSSHPTQAADVNIFVFYRLQFGLFPPLQNRVILAGRFKRARRRALSFR